MGQFGNLIVALLIVNVFLGVFGLSGVGTGSLISELVSGNATLGSLWSTLLNSFGNLGSGLNWNSIFGVAVGAIGFVTKRDELIYGGVVIFLANAIGLLNFIPAMFPVSLEVLGNMLKALLSIYFGWTAIEWLRGKD